MGSDHELQMTNRKTGLPAIQDKPASGNFFHLWQIRDSGSISLSVGRDSIYFGLIFLLAQDSGRLLILRRHAATLYDFNKGKSPLLDDQPHLAKWAG